MLTTRYKYVNLSVFPSFRHTWEVSGWCLTGFSPSKSTFCREKGVSQLCLFCFLRIRVACSVQYRIL